MPPVANAGTAFCVDWVCTMTTPIKSAITQCDRYMLEDYNKAYLRNRQVVKRALFVPEDLRVPWEELSARYGAPYISWTSAWVFKYQYGIHAEDVLRVYGDNSTRKIFGDIVYDLNINTEDFGIHPHADFIMFIPRIPIVWLDGRFCYKEELTLEEIARASHAIN